MSSRSSRARIVSKCSARQASGSARAVRAGQDPVQIGIVGRIELDAGMARCGAPHDRRRCPRRDRRRPDRVRAGPWRSARRRAAAAGASASCSSACRTNCSRSRPRARDEDRRRWSRGRARAAAGSAAGCGNSARTCRCRRGHGATTSARSGGPERLRGGGQVPRPRDRAARRGGRTGASPSARARPHGRACGRPRCGSSGIRSAPPTGRRRPRARDRASAWRARCRRPSRSRPAWRPACSSSAGEQDVGVLPELGVADARRSSPCRRSRRQPSSFLTVPAAPSTSISSPVADPVHRALEADHAGDAELARHDGRMRQQAAALDHDRRRVGEQRDPAGIGVARDQDLAVAQASRCAGRAPRGRGRAPFRRSSRSRCARVRRRRRAAPRGALERAADGGAGDADPLRRVGSLRGRRHLGLAQRDEALRDRRSTANPSIAPSTSGTVRKKTSRGSSISAARVQLVADRDEQAPGAAEQARALEAQVLAVAHARLGPGEHAPHHDGA